MALLSSQHFDIESWTNELVVASNRMPVCVDITLRIDRSAQRITYIRTRKPQASRETCGAVTERVVWDIT